MPASTSAAAAAAVNKSNSSGGKTNINRNDGVFRTFYRPILAEFIVMTLFVWCACANAMAVLASHQFSGNSPDSSLIVAIALLNGLVIAALIYTAAPISGAHMNPAVTFAFVITGRLPLVTGLFYVLAQCLGSTLGAAIAWGSTASSLLSEGKVLLPVKFDMCNA